MNCKPISIYENPGLATARHALHVALTVLAICIGVTAAGAQTWDYSQGSAALTDLPSAITPPYGGYPFIAAAIDSHGDVYLVSTSVTQPGSSNLFVYEVVAVDGQIDSSSQVVTVSLNVPVFGSAGLAVDPYGNVFVTVPGSTQSAVYEIEETNGQISATSTITTLGSNWKWPAGVAVDASGDVFVADYQAGTVEEFSWVAYGAFGHLRILESHAVGSGFQNPYGLAFDSIGNLYVSDAGSATVKKVTPVNGAFSTSSPVTQVGPSLAEPGFLAVDSIGNIIVQTACTGQTCPQSFDGPIYTTAMEEIAAVNGSAGPASPAIPIAQDLASSTGVALEPNGNILVADGAVGLAEITHPAANFGTFAVGQQSQVMMIPYRFGLPGSLKGWKVVTEGAAGLDFQEVQASTTCSTSGTYSAGETCSVAVQFAPQRPGARAGAVLFDVEGPTTVRDTLMSVIPVPLRGTGIAPQVSFSGGFATVPLWSFLNQPQGIAVDANGNIFFANSGDNSVQEIVAIGGAVSSYSYLVTVGTGFDAPQAIAVDGDGNVYVIDSGDGAAYEIPLSNAQAGQSVSPLLTRSLGSSQPALALDGDGNAFVYAWGGCGFVVCGAVYEFGAPYGQPFGGGGFALPLTLTTQGSAALAVDANGNAFFANGVTGSVQEIFAVNGRVSGASPVSTVSSGFNQPQGIAVDAAGDLFIANSGDGSIKEVMASNGEVNTSSPVATIAKGFQDPFGLAFDLSGNLYVTDAVANTVTELQLARTAPVTFPTPTGAGKVDTADGVRAITIANSGNAPLTFGLPNVGFNPSVSANFDWDNASTCKQTSANSSEAFQLAAGSTCTLSVDFAPVSAGAISGSIVLTDNTLNAIGATQSIAVSGTGFSLAIASLSATSLSYPATTVGSSSISHSVTMTNTGTATLSITSIALTGADASSFVFANTCGATLAAGANCIIHGHFAPTVAGALTAAVTITDSASNSPQSIALSGTGVEPPVTLSATSLAYGSVDVGHSSNSQSVTMTNTGSTALSIASIAVTGTNASSFVFANTCGTSLAVGASCTIHGHFAPTTAGALKATVTITDSAAGSPQSIALSGTGVAPADPVKLSATSLAYPATAVGSSSASQSVTMTNTGTTALAITSIAVTGADASSFVFANTCGTSLAAGASCTIHGHFAPTTTGALTASVTISDSAAGSPQTIALSGTGN